MARSTRKASVPAQGASVRGKRVPPGKRGKIMIVIIHHAGPLPRGSARAAAKTPARSKR
jgi:hypothetical protein